MNPVSRDQQRTSCRDVVRLLGAYLDGELDAGQLLEVEGHLGGCTECSERFELQRAVRGTLKRVTKVSAPDALRERLLLSMNAEKARAERRELEEGDTRANRALGWKTMIPLSAAAALALYWSGARSWNRAMEDGALTAGVDPLTELVSLHSRPLPPERTDPREVRTIEQYVGVPVRPVSFRNTHARLLGWRVLPVSQERAAMLQYEIGQGPAAQRVSVFIYDPKRIRVSGHNLEPRAVGTAQVQVGREMGYSVAVTQRAGVGYALATDLDQERSAELAATVDAD